VFELRSFEKEAFLNYKEEIYENRRARVSKYCQYLLQQNFGQKGRIKNYFSNRFELFGIVRMNKFVILPIQRNSKIIGHNNDLYGLQELELNAKNQSIIIDGRTIITLRVQVFALNSFLVFC